MNPTKQELIDALSAGIESVTTSTTALTDQEFKDCWNSMLDTVKVLDPIKGTPGVKF